MWSAYLLYQNENEPLIVTWTFPNMTRFMTGTKKLFDKDKHCRYFGINLDIHS